MAGSSPCDRTTFSLSQRSAPHPLWLVSRRVWAKRKTCDSRRPSFEESECHVRTFFGLIVLQQSYDADILAANTGSKFLLQFALELLDGSLAFGIIEIA